MSAAAYSAAKGAVHAWTRTAAGRGARDNIRVNAILPAMATPMYREALARATEAQKTASYWANLSSIAMGQQYGDPDRDLGPVMVFLASDASRFITGQLIPGRWRADQRAVTLQAPSSGFEITTTSLGP